MKILIAMLALFALLVMPFSVAARRVSRARSRMREAEASAEAGEPESSHYRNGDGRD